MHENNLRDSFTYGQDDAMALVEVVNLHRPTVDVSRVAPTGVETNSDAVAAPGAA